jgi:periplasmic divalent cation tolerance protein
VLVVLTTTPNLVEAELLAERLVSAKFAACVQVLPQMTSFYFWQGELQKEGEYLLLIKTLEEKFEDLESFIRANHSYDVPEIVAIRSEGVSAPYQKWLTEYLSST